MTLDPRAQLAQTMLTGLTNHSEHVTRKRLRSSNEPDHLRKEHKRRSMEALTQALLNPCTTVQEAVMDSLIQRMVIDSPPLKGKNRTSG